MLCGRQPRAWRWAFSTFHGAIPSCAASWWAGARPADATCATARRLLASALVTNTFSIPVPKPHRSSSSAPARSPSIALSAMTNPLASARPRWYSPTTSAVIGPSVSQSSWLAAEHSSRRSLPTASIRAVTASSLTCRPSARSSARTNSRRSLALVTLAQSTRRAPAPVSEVMRALPFWPPACSTTTQISGTGSAA